MKRKNKDEMINDILLAWIFCKKQNLGEDCQLAQVAAKANISVRTLNRYFPNKEDLRYLAALKYLEQQHSVYGQMFDEMDKSGKMGRECLIMFLRSQKNYYKTNPVDSLLLLQANNIAARVTPDAGEKRIDVGRDLRHIIFSCIDQGVKDGSIRSDLSPQMISALLGATFNGLQQRIVVLYNMSKAMQSDDEIFKLFDRYIDMLEGYIKQK